MKRALSALILCIAMAGCGVASNVSQPVPMTPLGTGGGRAAQHARAAHIYSSGFDANTTGVYGLPEIGIFSSTANGNVAAQRTVKGSSTGFVALSTLTVDSTGAMWACDFDSNRAYKFAASASGNVAPAATLGAGTTALDDCNGVAVSTSGTLYVSSFGEDTGFKPSVFVWKAGASSNAQPYPDDRGSKDRPAFNRGQRFRFGRKTFRLHRLSRLD